MENTMKMYVTADEAAQILGVSRGYAKWLHIMMLHIYNIKTEQIRKWAYVI